MSRSMRSCTMRRRSALLAAACALILPVAAVAALPAPSPAAFDALFATLDVAPRDHADSRGRMPEFQRLRALVPPGDEARLLRIDALQCGAGLYDDTARIAADAQALIERARRRGDADALARAYYCLGDARSTQRDERASIGEYSQGIEAARRAGLTRLLGEGLALRAATLSMIGEHAVALLDLMEAQREYERGGESVHAERNLLGLAVAYRRMGEFDAALEHLVRAERAARRRADDETTYTALLQQGYLLYDRNAHADSLAPVQQALALAERQRDPGNAAYALAALAASQVRLGGHAQALDLIERAQAQLGDATHGGGVDMLVHLRRGEALAGLGRHTEALVEFDRVAAELGGSDNPRYVSMLRRARAASLEAVGRHADAFDDYRRVLAAQTELDALARAQQEVLMRHRFDVERRDLEHRRLAADRALRDQQLAAQHRARQWRTVTLVASIVLVLVLAGLGVRQLRRGRTLHALAMTDPLTGAANRRSLERFAALAIEDCAAASRPLSVVALDVDYFKRINDRHGHAAGDAVLRTVAATCRHELRQADLLGRTGGEEFVAVLPGIGRDAALGIAERLRVALTQLDFGNEAPGLAITASLGVAEHRAGDADFRTLLQRADRALYRAKRRGRNRIECDLDDDGAHALDGSAVMEASPRVAAPVAQSMGS
jgi:diguanylate cyclase (GGDEF)-like protein